MNINTENLLFGLDTFGDVAFDTHSGKQMTYSESLNNIIQEGKLADEVGVDIFALGEHHREEYSITSPDVLLAALATVTSKIKLGSGVTVLSSDDPVRVYERFATLDALSNGRAQVMLGRGSFTESFPLFGYDLRDYNELFEEKIALFDLLLNEEPINWKGTFTQSLHNMEVFPKIGRRKLETYVGVGGSPESILRAAKYGFPVMLAIIGGKPENFAQYVTLYQRGAAQYNQPILPVGMHAHGVIADTDEEAYAIGWSYIKKSMDEIGRDRGWPEMSKARFDFEVKEGAYYIGSPETVAQKIAQTMPKVGVERFDLVYGAGGQLQQERMKTIELYGKVVIPRVKELLQGVILHG